MNEQQVTAVLNVKSGAMGGIATMLGGFSEVISVVENFTANANQAFGTVDAGMIASGALALATGAKFAQMFADFERGMDIVGAVSGFTTGEMNKISAAAKQMSVQFRMDTKDMTEGLATLGRAGLSSVEASTQTLAEGLKLAKIEGMDLQETLEGLIQTTSLLGGDMDSANWGQQVKEINDLLLSTSMSAPIDVQDILNTLKYSGGMAAVGGADIEGTDRKVLHDYMGAISAFSLKGVTGDMAGTALRAFLSRPTTQDSNVIEGLGQIGLSPEDLWEKGGDKMKPISEQIGIINRHMKDLSKFEQMDIWSKIVGPRMSQQMLKLDENTIRKQVRKIESGISSDSMFDKSMSNLGSSWDKFMKQISVNAIEVGEMIAVFLKPILDIITAIVSVLNNPLVNLFVFIVIITKIREGVQGLIKLLTQVRQVISNIGAATQQTDKDILPQVDDEKAQFDSLQETILTGLAKRLEAYKLVQKSSFATQKNEERIAIAQQDAVNLERQKAELTNQRTNLIGQESQRINELIGFKRQRIGLGNQILNLTKQRITAVNTEVERVRELVNLEKQRGTTNVKSSLPEEQGVEGDYKKSEESVKSIQADYVNVHAKNSDLRNAYDYNDIPKESFTGFRKLQDDIDEASSKKERDKGKGSTDFAFAHLKPLEDEAAMRNYNLPDYKAHMESLRQVSAESENAAGLINLHADANARYNPIIRQLINSIDQETESTNKSTQAKKQNSQASKEEADAAFRAAQQKRLAASLNQGGVQGAKNTFAYGWNAGFDKERFLGNINIGGAFLDGNVMVDTYRNYTKMAKASGKGVGMLTKLKGAGAAASAGLGSLASAAGPVAIIMAAILAGMKILEKIQKDYQEALQKAKDRVSETKSTFDDAESQLKDEYIKQNPESEGDIDRGSKPYMDNILDYYGNPTQEQWDTLTTYEKELIANTSALRDATEAYARATSHGIYGNQGISTTLSSAKDAGETRLRDFIWNDSDDQLSSTATYMTSHEEYNRRKRVGAAVNDFDITDTQESFGYSREGKMALAMGMTKYSELYGTEPYKGLKNYDLNTAKELQNFSNDVKADNDAIVSALETNGDMIQNEITRLDQLVDDGLTGEDLEKELDKSATMIAAASGTNENATTQAMMVMYLSMLQQRANQLMPIIWGMAQANALQTNFAQADLGVQAGSAGTLSRSEAIQRSIAYQMGAYLTGQLTEDADKYAQSKGFTNAQQMYRSQKATSAEKKKLENMTAGNIQGLDMAVSEDGKTYRSDAAALEASKGLLNSETSYDWKNTLTKGYTDKIFNQIQRESGDGGIWDLSDGGTLGGSTRGKGGSDKGSGSSSKDGSGSNRVWVDLAICKKKFIPDLNVNLFKKPPSFLINNKNLKIGDIKVNTADKPKHITNAVKNAVIDIQNTTNPKIIQDEKGAYDPAGATSGSSVPVGTTDVS